MAGVGTVAVKFVGDVKDLESSVSGAESKIAGFGKAAALGFAAVGAAAAGVGVALFKVGSDFDEAYDQIRTGTGKTGAALDGLKDTFKDVVSSVPTDFASASTAITKLNQTLGLTGQPLEDMSTQILNLSRITGTDVATNVDTLTGLFNNFGVSAADQGAKLDILFRASQQTGVSVDALAASMADGGVKLRAAGLTFDESAALLGTLEKAGLDAGDVMPALGKAMAVAAANMEPLSDVLKYQFDKIKNAPSDTMAASAALEVFGMKAGPQLAAMIREGSLGYEELLATIGQGDTINAAAADTADFAEKWQVFKNRVLVGLEPLASGVFNALGNGMELLSDVARDLFAAIRGGPIFEDSPLYPYAGFIVNVLIPTFHALKDGVTDAFAVIRATVDEVVGFVSGLLDRFRTDHDNAASGIGQASSRIGEILGSLREMFSAAFGAIRAVVQTAVAVLTEIWSRFGVTLVEKLGFAIRAISDALGGAVAMLTGIFDLIKAILTGKWGEAWDAIKQILGGAWDLIGGVLRAGLAAITAAIEAAKAGISAAWSAIWNAVKTAFTDAFGGVKTAVAEGVLWVVQVVKALPGQILEALGDLATLMVAPFKTAFNAIARLWNKGPGSLSFKVPGWVPGIGGKGFDVPDIPYLADGGIVKARPGGTLALIGEGGRDEAVVPLGRGLGLGMSFNPTVNLTINGAGNLDERRVADLVGEQLRKQYGALRQASRAA